MCLTCRFCRTMFAGSASVSLPRPFGVSKRSFARVPHVPDVSFLPKLFLWLGERTVLTPTMDQDGPVAIIVADDAHSAYIAQAKSNAAPGQRSILVTAGGKQTARADIYLPADIDAGSLANAIAGLSADPMRG